MIEIRKTNTEIENLLNRIRKFGEFAESYTGVFNVQSPHYQQLVEKHKIIYEYSGLHKPESNLGRFVSNNQVLVVTPPSPEPYEILLANWIANRSSEAVDRYVNFYGFSNNTLLPTIMYRSNDEVSRIAKRKEWSGVISLSYAPLYTTFNIQGMKFALDKLGLETAIGATEFSFKHEIAHPIMNREQITLATQAGYNPQEIAEHTRSLMQTNQTAYEVAANDIQDNHTFYPNAVALTEDRNPLINRRNIMQYSYETDRTDSVLNEKLDKILYPFQSLSLQDSTKIEVPFVTSAQCAHSNIIEVQVLEDYRNKVNPNFSWTGYLLEKLHEDPLVHNGIPMPPKLDQIF